MYKIQPYIWQDIKGNRTVFQTQNSTTVINNKILRDFLVAVEEKKDLYLDKKKIEETFGVKEAEKVIAFLIKQKILKEQDEKSIDIKRAVILSNDLNFIESVNYNLKNIYEICFINHNKLEKITFCKTDLLIVFLNPFELKDMEKIVAIVNKKNVLSKFIFSYNNKIYFSNFYKKSWYNPCPLCFFYEIESQLRGESSETNINFQTIIDLLYAEKIMFRSNLPLDKAAYLNISYYLSRYMCCMANDYKLDEVLELNLSDYSVKKDIAYHWGYCDCYE